MLRTAKAIQRARNPAVCHHFGGLLPPPINSSILPALPQRQFPRGGFPLKKK